MDGSTFSRLPTALRVLVADDHQINRFVLARMLELSRCVVTEACTGLEAVEQASRADFDLILLDLAMPRMDGAQAAREIRQGTGANARVLMAAVSAHIPAEDRPALTAAGFDHFIEKPVRIEAVHAIVAEATARAHAVGR